MPERGEPETQGAREEAHFIANMKRIREEQGWSQGEFAKRMKDAEWEAFHQTTVSRIEKGERPVRLGEARGIAQVLGTLVGQMILPTSGSKALRDLELTVQDASRSASILGQAAEDFIFERSMIRERLKDLAEADLGNDVDEGIAERRDMVMKRAERELERKINTVIEEWLNGDHTRPDGESGYGIDPEAS